MALFYGGRIGSVRQRLNIFIDVCLIAFLIVELHFLLECQSAILQNLFCPILILIGIKGVMKSLVKPCSKRLVFFSLRILDPFEELWRIYRLAFLLEFFNPLVIFLELFFYIADYLRLAPLFPSAVHIDF